MLDLRYRKTPAGAVASYAPPSDGPFRCDHCEYSSNDATHCRKPEVIREAFLMGRSPLRSGPAPIEPEGCCNFFEKRD